MIIIYFFIALLATSLGSLVGLGGGVIIKPLLDLLNQFDLTTIGVLSSSTVFIMTIVAIISNITNGIAIEKSLIWVALGSVIGGYFGKVLIAGFVELVVSDSFAKAIQSSILGLLMLVVFFAVRTDRELAIKQSIVSGLVIGLLLGTVSSFLGIGGGPLNIVVLTIFYGLEKKYAAFGSVFLIFASQGAKLLTLLWAGQSQYFIPAALIGLIPGAVIGGYFGSRLYRRINSESIIRIFSVAVIVLMLLNFALAYKFFNMASA